MAVEIAEVLTLPDGFKWMTRDRADLYAMPFVHVRTGKEGAIPGVVVKTGGANQDELNYQCSKLLREVARGS